jgi:hypothetical protein
MAERHEAIVVGRSGGTRVNDKAYFVAIRFWTNSREYRVEKGAAGEGSRYTVRFGCSRARGSPSSSPKQCAKSVQISQTGALQTSTPSRMHSSR